MFQGRVQYLLPIHLTNMERPDLAMALSIMDGYYIGHTCLTLEMAYQNARLLPDHGWWLTQLVSESARWPSRKGVQMPKYMFCPRCGGKLFYLHIEGT